MPSKIGTADVSFRLGSATPTALYVGTQQVWAAVTVPEAPTQITYSYNTAIFEWTVNWADADDGGSEILYYELQRSDDTFVIAQTWTEVTDNPATLSGSASGNNYLRVRAVNAIGAGPWSAWGEIWVPE